MFVKGGLSLRFNPAEIGPISLVTTADGPALKCKRGLLNVYDLIRDHLSMDEVTSSAHIEQAEGDRLHWSMDTGAELYDVLCSRGATAENDEDSGDGEDDSRDLPRSEIELDGRQGATGAVPTLGGPLSGVPAAPSSIAA